MKCRFCKSELNLKMADLGITAPSNSYILKKDINKNENKYPLRVYVCEKCWLTQTEDFADVGEFFSQDYAYFSSYSSSWLDHCKKFSKDIIKDYKLDDNSLIVEVASNDGYLLKNFQERNIPCLGIEPTESTAKISRSKGIKTLDVFFGEIEAIKIKKEFGKADLIIANNVLAHVPDINDFIRGFKVLLKSNGLATFEFPHVLELIKHSQFDTIYHEHFSYLSLVTTKNILNKNGLDIFKVEKINTHGGSLRIYVKIKDCNNFIIDNSVKDTITEEINFGIKNREMYLEFQKDIDNIKYEFINFFKESKLKKLKIAAYGAAAKGNTLINYSGITKEEINYIVDSNPYKQGKLTPNSHIPITKIDKLIENKPDIIIILPWNLSEEIKNYLDTICSWNVKYITFIPKKKFL